MGYGGYQTQNSVSQSMNLGLKDSRLLQNQKKPMLYFKTSHAVGFEFQR